MPAPKKTAAAAYDVVVLGAGGAGLMCASVAGQRGRRVLLIDHAKEPGKKILISGGGRCNFTNWETAADRYISRNAHFAKSALSRYTPHDFVALVESYGIAWHVKTLGQLFCDGSARQIVDMLTEECRAGDVEVELAAPIREVTHSDGHFRIRMDSLTATAPALVIATGGPSIPKMGATGFAYELARQFGLKVVEPKPALVPLKLSGEEALFKSLSGVSADVIARCGDTAFREACLFTHKGLSGPAILQISSYWNHREEITIDFLPDIDGDWLLQTKRETPRAGLRRAIAHHLPERLAAALAERIPVDGHLADCSDSFLRAISAQLHHWPFHPTGTEGFAKAEVTRGGIDTAELSSRTMEAKRVPGLFVIGEAVDVTGWLGGYNFQWAWASGHAAGEALS